MSTFVTRESGINILTSPDVDTPLFKSEIREKNHHQCVTRNLVREIILPSSLQKIYRRAFIVNADVTLKIE